MTLERFRLAAALPPEGGWRLELVLDASVAPARPVVLARVPPAITGDALALTALMRDVERAVRLPHPALLPVRGLADAGGLAVLCDWREGEPLRDLLAAGGPLGPPLAARVLLAVAEALQAVHAGGAVHGDVRAERILVGEDGAVLLTGLGRCGAPGATPEDDLAGLARLATDCLGAAPGQGEVAAAVVAASVQPTAAEAAAALRRLGPASPSEVATRLEAVLPSDGAARSARRLALTTARRPTQDHGPAAERPALSPPPLPTGLRTVSPRAVAAPAPPRAPVALGAPAQGALDAPPHAVAAGPARPPLAPPRAPVPTAGLARADRRLPVAVGVVMGLVGLVAGYWLGR